MAKSAVKFESLEVADNGDNEADLDAVAPSPRLFSLFGSGHRNSNSIDHGGHFWTCKKVAALTTITSLVTMTLTYLTMMGVPFWLLYNSETTNLRQQRMGSSILADIRAYPGYEGPLEPRGRVTVRFENDDSEFLLRYELDGFEPNCTRCSIRIHEGDSCEDGGSIQGHHYNHTMYSLENPWDLSKERAVYNTDVSGYASNAFVMSTGVGDANTKGKIVVVEGKNGTRIGCGLLGPTYNINFMRGEMGRFPLYEGKYSPSGTVRLFAFEDNVLRVRATLRGLQPDCYQCGAHLHKGISCNDTDVDEVGSHWYNEKLMEEDPWLAEKATYTSDSKGHTNIAYYIYNGYDYEKNLDHVLVIHADDGSRIGCAELKSNERPW